MGTRVGEVKCGKVSIEFRNLSSRARLECACFSCRQRQEWSTANGCPGVQKYAAPADLTWLDNAVTSVEGEELLCTRVLRAGSDTRWLASTCCHSVLVVSNPLYKGNIVAVTRATSTLVCDDTTPPRARIQTKEWSARKVGAGYDDETKMPHYSGSGPTLDGRSVVGLLWNLKSVGFLDAMSVKPHREEGDRTIEAIMAATGAAVAVGVAENMHVDLKLLAASDDSSAGPAAEAAV